MAANTDPRYPESPSAKRSGKLTTADTDKDGSSAVAGGATNLCFEAGTDGAFLHNVQWFPYTESGHNTTAAVGRVWVADSGGTVIAGPYEVTLPAITNSETVVQTQIVAYIGLDIPTDANAYASISVTQSGNAGWYCSGFGADY